MPPNKGYPVRNVALTLPVPMLEDVDAILGELGSNRSTWARRLGAYWLRLYRKDPAAALKLISEEYTPPATSGKKK